MRDMRDMRDMRNLRTSGRRTSNPGGPALSKFNNFSASDLSKIKPAYDAARKGLESLIIDIGNGTGRGTKFDTNFVKYFGPVEKSSLIYLTDCVKAMAAKIASLTFKVYYDANYTGGNAMMASYITRNVATGQNFASVDDIQNLELAQTNTGGSRMTIGPSCLTQTMWQQDGQCIIESFLHELSHHAAGTVDDNNGGECYGLIGVNRLKAMGSDRATRNAESVGFFCMAWVGRIN
jgi:hypothetical protein